MWFDWKHVSLKSTCPLAEILCILKLNLVPQNCLRYSGVVDYKTIYIELYCKLVEKGIDNEEN